MVLSIGIQISAFLFIAVLTAIYFSKERLLNIENRLYGILIVMALVNVLFEFWLCINIAVGVELYSLYNLLLNRLFLLSLYSWFTLFSIYIVYVSFQGNKDVINKLTSKFGDEYIKKISPFLMAIVGITVFFIFVLPIDLVSDGQNAYSDGMAANLLITIIAFYCILWTVTVLLNIKRVGPKKYMPMFSLIVILIVVFIIRYFEPSLLLNSFLTAFSSYIMYHTIENPDLKIIEQLNLAKDYAEKANAAKTDFLSSMSHEIRTPLNAVVGFSECILTADDLSEAKENAADIVNASQTLLEIVNGILDISKIEAGKMEIINTDYNAVEMFENIRRLSKARLGDKELELKFDIAEDLPKVLYGDHANLKKVIINLVTNAIKYTEKGYVDFKVSCIFNSGVCRLIVTVEDSGRGIKKDQVDKLFTKFQRLDEDRNTTIEGTGLGLAITKKIIELMGGQIVVQSVYGRGSRFTIAIDQRVSEAQESELEKKEVVEKKDIDFSSKKILIVDDNKLNLKVATKILSDYKVKIETCESGYECIEKVESGEVYDLILLDDMMPKMSGVETLSKLRSIEKFSIPTVALTANAIAGMREKYLHDGFVDYLAKPIEKVELDRVLNSYLRDSEELSEITKEIEKISSEKKRVLIVDDNKLNIVVASKFLKNYNINIESVNSGQECIERIKSGVIYDLIFMDDMMPILDGVSTYHELSKIEGFSIPVVALTANAMEGSREHYLSEGFNEYMSKPIDKNELNRIINLFVLKD